MTNKRRPPGIVVALAVLVFASAGLFFLLRPAPVKETPIAVSEEMPKGTEEIPALAPANLAPTTSTDNVKYNLGYAPFTAADQGGLKYKTNVISFGALNEEGMSKLQEHKCADISLEGQKVTDQELQDLSKLKDIYMLDLQNTHGYSPKGLYTFKETTLKKLHLYGTAITDQWMPVISQLPLEYLSLMGNKLSDESYATLAKSKTLKFLKFETANSRKLYDAFREGGWMRLPGNSNNNFDFHRPTIKAAVQ